MKRSMVAVLLVVLGFTGCGPEGHVLHNKLRRKIDSLLGDMEVQRECIDERVLAIKHGIHVLGVAATKADIERERLPEQVASFKEQLADVDRALEVVRAKLITGEPASFGGQSYDRPELQGLVASLQRERGSVAAQLDELTKRGDELGRLISLLETKRQACKEGLQQCKERLARLDTQKRALDALRETTEAIGGDADDNLSDALKNLVRKIDNLESEFKAGLIEQTEPATGAEAVNRDVDSVIAAIKEQEVKPVAAPVAEILDKR